MKSAKDDESIFELNAPKLKNITPNLNNQLTPQEYLDRLAT